MTRFADCKIMQNRRQFERLTLSDDAIVVDESGRRLGLVSQASGGGMLIRLEVPSAEFQIGQRLRVRILEPASNISHSIDIQVRYQNAESLGVEFVGRDSRAEAQ